MKRRYIPLDSIEFNVSKDKKSIDYMVLHLGTTGHKCVPVLVLDNHDGTYTCMDGHKRLTTYHKLGLWKNIEAFIGDHEGDSAIFEGQEMVCEPNGQHFIKSLLEAEEGVRVPETVLAQSNNFKIELRENIHVHYKNIRHVMGPRDFIALSDAIARID